jgi:hypothetical protein
MSTVIGIMVIYYWGVFCAYVCGLSRTDMFYVCSGECLVRTGEFVEKFGVKCKMVVEKQEQYR